jgi:hypothetical protein
MLGDGFHTVCKTEEGTGKGIHVSRYLVSLRVEKGWQRRIHPQSVLRSIQHKLRQPEPTCRTQAVQGCASYQLNPRG